MVKTVFSSRPASESTTPKPLYEQVKSYVMDNILSGNWQIHSQIPSEHTLVRELRMSRMTIHRALRELTANGFLNRIQGVGTFVANPKEEKTSLKLADIKDMIIARGNRYASEVKFLQSEPIEPDMAPLLQLDTGSTVFRSYIIHCQNDLPVILEDRFTSPALAPELLNQDFSKQTTEHYFREQYNLLTHQHQISAQPSTPEHHHFLRLEQPVACVQIIRKSWIGTQLLSYAKYTLAANRFQLHC
ncbi:UTRA domain-containing protein [Sneathiella glossodoripedis]|uniref:UTRA domain-containing protein n=1 Tax=Sneathiella glossodoripedis TaxID=418853 RepID=UPI00047018E8|nr:UTRA domain-containing protein [Sneathiella glossodoripedis]